MGSLFGKKPKAPKQEPAPHMALQDREARDMFKQNRVYTAMDAMLGIRRPRRESR